MRVGRQLNSFSPNAKIIGEILQYHVLFLLAHNKECATRTCFVKNKVSNTGRLLKSLEKVLCIQMGV